MRLQTRTDMIGMATTMYGGPLPDALIDRLLEINRLASLCGGAVVSRQIIAMVVEQYKREKEANACVQRRV